MKSNICHITNTDSHLEALLGEVEKVAVYNALPARPARRLRLLAEELVTMLPALLEYGSAEFWVENNGTAYELHAVVSAYNDTVEMRNRVLALSHSGKNAAYAGILGKIRAAAESFLVGYENPTVSALTSSSMVEAGVDSTAIYFANDLSARYDSVWTLSKYRADACRKMDDAPAAQPVENDTPAWDELEKSIINNLSDDVIVGIFNRKVEIKIIKDFAKEIAAAN